ncbi:MAG: hypothetical protein WDM76_03155 [Limisphaerales bacterium]
MGVGESKGNSHQIWYGGTGFFVGVDSKRISGASFLYLVTAKHVADKLKHPNFWLRANTRDGRAMHLMADQNTNWIFHSTDKAADIAIMPMGLDQKVFDYLGIHCDSILTEKMRLEKGIGIGDEVFITGLFVHHQGNQKNLPIVRTGNIAMIPDERIPIKNFGDMDAYLIEARSIGGLSGSPVFTIHHDMKLPAGTVYLMRLMHGHWDVKSDKIIDEVEQDSGIKAGINVGIAIVTPAFKILDILNCDELIKARTDFEDKTIALNSPMPG